MTRYVADFCYPKSYAAKVLNYGQTKRRSDFQNFRNYLRTVLDGSDFTVSDIASWGGNSSDYAASAFVIKKDSHEWLFCVEDKYTGTYVRFGYLLAGYSSSSNPFLEKIFRCGDDLTPVRYNSSYYYGMLFLYNGGKNSFNMGFDDQVNLSYTGGDFSPPAVNPASSVSNAESFFGVDSSVNIPSGFELYEHSTGAHNPDTMFIFDDVENAITVYHYGRPGSGNDKRFVLMSGEIFNNYDPIDTDINGTFIMNLGQGVGNPPTVSDYYIYAYDMAGNIDSFGYTRHTDFTPFNRLDSNDNFRWGSIAITNDNYQKGILKTNLAINVGAWDSWLDTFRIIDGPDGPYYRFERGLAFPYATGLERFPWPSRNIFLDGVPQIQP